MRRIGWTVTLVLIASAVTVALGRLKPAAPEVQWSAIWPDTVKRGLMLRQVRGVGTLVAEETVLIAATTDGRVERILIYPGTPVTAESVIMTLSNPVLEQETLDAGYQVKMAEARSHDLEVKLLSETLTQKAEVARVEGEHTEAKLRLDRDENLYREKLIIELNYKLSKSKEEEMARRVVLERERLDMRARSVDAQLAVARSEIEKLQALHRLKLSQVEALKVSAGVAGVLQELPVQVGQRVPAGTIIAKVAQPERLKAELKIPETQVKDVVIGQKAEIDTRNGIIPGKVFRIDPAAREGTVTVDVRLEGKLPDGARPDLSVDGTVEVERLADVIHVGRPASAQPGSQMSLFRISPDRKEADRVTVRFGKASVNTIEVREGLKVGDQVILSEMSDWDGHDRIALK